MLRQRPQGIVMCERDPRQREHARPSAVGPAALHCVERRPVARDVAIETDHDPDVADPRLRMAIESDRRVADQAADLGRGDSLDEGSIRVCVADQRVRERH